MPDDLLTTLCGICHIAPPRYTCPRCAIRTCSSACVGKHKVWASCSGVRDATKYLPPRTLKTAWGVDHEYNFLKSVERTMELAEKELVEERGLLQQEELQAPMVQRETRFQRQSDGSRKLFKVVKVHDPSRSVKPRRIELHLHRKLRAMNTHVDMVPKGMQRQKDNGTNINRKSRVVSWQVEWLVVGGGADEASDGENSGEDGDEEDDETERIKRPKTARVLSKTPETTPLYLAFHATQRREDEKQRKEDDTAAETSWDRLVRTLNPAAFLRAQPGMQNRHHSNWEPATVPIQDPKWASWHSTASSAPTWPSTDDDDQRSAYRYFLARPRQRDDQKTVVTPLKEDDCLGEVLRDTRVLEFPTIYVFPQGVELGDAFALGDKDPAPEQVQRQEREVFAGQKRRGGGAGGARGGAAAAAAADHGHKRMRTADGPVKRAKEEGEEEGEEEEGEIGSQDEEEGEAAAGDSDDETSSSGSGSSDENEDGEASG